MHSINVSVLTDPLFRGFSLCGQFMRESLFWLQVISQFRRFYLRYFRKDYMREQFILRTEECRQYGMCCTLLSTCPMLTRQGLRLVYGKCRPQACRVFPIDQKDVDQVTLCGGKCGYQFARTSFGQMK